MVESAQSIAAPRKIELQLTSHVISFMGGPYTVLNMAAPRRFARLALLGNESPAVSYQDEGSEVATFAEVSSINFVGAGVTATYSLGVLTVTISGGGGGGSADWGDIGGTLSDQADLQAALNGKAASVHTHTAANITDFSTAADLRVTAGINAHLAAGDPHPQYLTPAEGNAAYSLLGHGHAQADITGLGTGDTPQFAGVNIGHASDTTVTRSAAGQVAVEGKRIFNDGDKGTIGCVIDGGGVAITTGIKGDIGPMTFAGTLEVASLIADQAGSIVIDIWKDSYANFPPVVGDTITAAAKPTISAAVKAQDATLTGWTVAFAIGDIFRINVDSCATIQRVGLTLQFKRT